MSAPMVTGHPWTPRVSPEEADELLGLLDLARGRRDDVARDLDELRRAPERLDGRGRLLTRVTQETLATELQLWTREVVSLETTALLVALPTHRTA